MKRLAIVSSIILILGAMQFATAQRMSQASQTVTFSVRSSHHSIAIDNATIPADVKVTATLDMPTAAGTSRETDLRTLAEQSTSPAVRQQNHPGQTAGTTCADRTALLASRATLLTITQ